MKQWKAQIVLSSTFLWFSTLVSLDERDRGKKLPNQVKRYRWTESWERETDKILSS